MQRGISKVVNSKKNNEIPSTPKVTFRFNTGIQKIVLTNWNVPTDFLNPPHKKRNIMNGREEKCNATFFNKFSLVESIKIIIIIPINGINEEYINIS